jgi:hypothetical protein
MNVENQESLEMVKCKTCPFYDPLTQTCNRDPVPLARLDYEGVKAGVLPENLRGCRFHPMFREPSAIDQILQAIPAIMASQGIGGGAGSIFGGEEMPKVDEEPDGDN